MTEFFSNLIGDDYLATVIMSLVPLIELKGGIVFAMDAGIKPLLAFLLAYLGSTAAFFPVFWLLRPILNLLKKIKFIDKFALKLEGYFDKKAKAALLEQEGKTKKKRSADFIKTLAVFIFVAIPLPMTGVWTGTAVAVFLNLKFTKSTLAVTVGNFIAGLLILLLSTVCVAIGIKLDYVLGALLILAAVLLIVFIVKVATTKEQPQEKEGEKENNR